MMISSLIKRARQNERLRSSLRPIVVRTIAAYFERRENLRRALRAARARGRESLRKALRPTVVAAFARYYKLRLSLFDKYNDRKRQKSERREFYGAAWVPIVPGILPILPGIGRNAKGDQIVMLVISDLRIDPRVEREARALAAGGWKVLVLYPDVFSPDSAPERVDWGPGVSFERLPLAYANYMMSFPGLYGTDLLRAAMRHKPFAFHAHDLSTANIGLAAGNATGAHVVCDFHEWSSENVEWKGAGWVPIQPRRKKIWRQAERLALTKASTVITVCGSIASDLEKELGDGRQQIHVVRNIPDLSLRPTREYPPLRQQYGVSEDAFLLLWQGGTGPSRFLEPVIESLKHAPGVVLIIRGPSLDLFGEGYEKLARENAVADRLILAPPVPSKDVVAAARGADAGIWTIPALCKNFTYALPNKIFEYLAAGVPVLCADYPEARRLVEGYDVGVIFDPVDPKSIAAAMMTLKDDPGRRGRIVRRIPAALDELNAGREWNKIATIYDSLRKARGAPVKMTPLGRSI
jgi:glycosyltransferase involved in cell wall biosynthesis